MLRCTAFKATGQARTIRTIFQRTGLAEVGIIQEVVRRLVAQAAMRQIRTVEAIAE